VVATTATSFGSTCIRNTTRSSASRSTTAPPNAGLDTAKLVLPSGSSQNTTTSCSGFSGTDPSVCCLRWPRHSTPDIVTTVAYQSQATGVTVTVTGEPIRASRAVSVCS